jgi:uncharacterized protein
MAGERGKKLSVSEAGRKGGESVAEKYGPGFYERIGSKGGETVAGKYGHEHFEEIGRKGGRKVADLIEKGKQASR